MNPMPKGSSYPKQLPPTTSQPSAQQIQFDQWVDKYAIMKEFNISERTLYTLRKNNELPFARLGRMILYNRTKLEQRLRKLSGMMMLLLHIVISITTDSGMPTEL
ncbi:MAG TPA: helix-turn-helix domain-containing protein [Chitinophagaceae bacterium]|nr:helix-turn-helix domain-containing protein [Chitinophagaceae bacterium]